MKKIILLIMLVVAILSLTACGSRFNPKWYSRGTERDTVCNFLLLSLCYLPRLNEV